MARQARALGISRSSDDYLPRPTSDADRAILRRIDGLHMDFPFAGSQMLRVLHRENVTIRRDGRGAWRGNVFVERLWRSIKYEEVCLRAYETRASLGR